jgi:Tol biopolymer transport system component/tRNA A-37 threonylcarbamoyl transferase component Bud32
MSLDPGSRFGTYDVEALIGAGGMGDVYRATDTALKRRVALKVLSESFVGDPNRLARLQREAELLAALNHANIAHIYGIERSGGTTALVMELVEGDTLATRLAQGPLPPSDALGVALQIVAALEAAHEQRIVHRDLKPANIKVKSDGTVKVLDFGIAKALDARAISGSQPPVLTTPAMTEAGVVLGTAAYMSPEQARGKPVDKRADVWAFGCVLYEMLTGRPAFAGDDVTTTLARVLEREPDLGALPRGLAPGVRQALELCLQKDPKKRLRDIGDVRLALEGGLAAPAAPSAAAPAWRRAWPIAAALVVGALFAGAFLLWNQRPPQTAAPAAALPVSRFVITPPASAPLSNLAGYDVIISPDGKRIAYFSQDPAGSGRTQLYVRELDGLEARPIQGADASGAGNLNPFFSPDGKWIAYRQPQKGIVRVSVEGAPSIKLADDPQTFVGGDWGADDTIVYSTGNDIWRMSAGGGGDKKSLTPHDEAQIVTGLASPTLLPGGRAVLFGRIDGAVERVGVLDLTTGEQKILVEGGQNPTYVAATGHLVFARGTTLMAAPFDAAELSLTGEPVALIQGVRHPSSQNAADYALSQNGTLVYVPDDGQMAGAGFAVVWVDRAGRVVGKALEEVVDTARDPRLSPDETRLVLSTGNFGDGSIWVYDLRGRPPIPLAVGGGSRGPVWSPDGKRIAFLRVSVQPPGIYTTLSDGSMLNPEPLRANGLRGLPAVWSSSGELILVTQGSGSADIVATAAAPEGEVRPIVATNDFEIDPALSPDGRWLAYASNRTGEPEIWVKRYPDGVPVRVSRSGGFEPVWSTDGKELFFLQGNAMMSVAGLDSSGDFSFGAPTQLFVGAFFTIPNPAARTYTVARDGRFLMIQPPGSGPNNLQNPGSIVVVQNWIEELKQRVPRRR